MRIGGNRVARSFRTDDWTPATPRVIRIDTDRLVWFDPEPHRNGRFYCLGRLPLDVPVSNRAAVLAHAKVALARTRFPPGFPTACVTPAPMAPTASPEPAAAAPSLAPRTTLSDE